MNRIERPNITTWERPEPPDWRSGCTTIVVTVVIAFLLGLIIGINAAARPAQTTAPATGATASDDRQAASGMTLTPTVADVTPSPSASAAPTEPPYSTRPTPTQIVGSVGTAMQGGTASHMGNTQGPGYLALPSGSGQHVTICGQLTKICINRVSTDAGPSLEMQREGRIADLYQGDFNLVCGVKPDEPDPGLCPVSVEYL